MESPVNFVDQVLSVGHGLKLFSSTKNGFVVKFSIPKPQPGERHPADSARFEDELEKIADAHGMQLFEWQPAPGEPAISSSDLGVSMYTVVVFRALRKTINERDFMPDINRVRRSGCENERDEFAHIFWKIREEIRRVWPLMSERLLLQLYLASDPYAEPL